MATSFIHNQLLQPPLPVPAVSLSHTKCKVSSKNDAAVTARTRGKTGFVDYDKGEHHVSSEVGGYRKSDLQRRYRLKVQGDRFQRDWSVAQVAQKLLQLDPSKDDLQGLLNHWIGRFARKNFPLLIREVTQSGALEHSLEVFKWMKNQKNYCARTDIYNMMIRLLARHHRVDQARGFFFEMQEYRCKPNSETYNALINAHGRAGQERWAMNILDDMLRQAIPPSRSTYNNLINACGSSGNWREALRLCKKMTENGVGPDLVTHNIILSAYKTAAQYSRALSYFELMKGTNIRPDTTTFNIVIYCLAKLGQYAKAVDIFNSMRDKRSETLPDVVTFTSIIHLYAMDGQIQNCSAAFNTMVAEGLKPNVVSFNALMGAYASHGMHKEALAVFNEIKRSGLRPDIVSYTSLLNSYGRSQQPQKAREIFDLMKLNKWKPNLVSYNALIDAYGSNGLLEKAVEVLREMEQDGIQPNVVSISTLLAACGRCGQKVNIDAVISAADMRSIKLNTVAYNSAIGSYLNVGEYEKASSLYRSMRKRKVKPNSVTYTILISGCCKMSRYDDALRYLAEMMDLKIPLTKEGKTEEAESIFNMMKENGCSPDVITYTTMLHAYGAAEDLDKACGLLQEMEACDVQLDTITCSALMRAFNKGGKPSKVFILAEYMREKELPFSDAVFFEMVSACSLSQDWKTMIDLIRLMEPSFSSVSIGLLNQVLRDLGKSGKIEYMIKVFYKMVSSGAHIDMNTYSILLKNLLAVGNWRKYLEVMGWMQDAGICPSDGMYSDIISFAQKSGGAKYAAIIKERAESLRTKCGKKISVRDL
ncbi:hypothetical protein Tsubulata_035841 [Turnera subulata]|uniref:Pentatricopeptide repeat-containing protein-mitochondrial domain-containing protein n=1 Tax=Turnera subulata TaxID=218843 RepID=A0A9Q0FVB5_9ROSI|nr:hypothetical protein Tsubulata_035841 [Turnera subulata]